MARYLGDDARYSEGADYVLTRPGLTPAEISLLSETIGASPILQVSPDQIVANQNDFPLPEGVLIRLSTDASRNITGFAGARSALTVICNVGAQNIVLIHQSASSSAANRIISHTGADLTINANESVLIVYDFTTTRWRTVAGTA